MEQKVEQLTLTIELIKNEIENFLQQHQNQNQQTKRLNSSCEENSLCDGTNLAQKLMQILENEDDARARAVQSPERKVMSNSLVVREILSHMDVHSLLNFRQVSRLWREEATSILSSQRHREQREEFLCVKFKMEARDGIYRHGNGETLGEFLEERAQNSGTFIYSGVILQGGPFKFDPPLDRLFSSFGSRIQHLNLSVAYLDVALLEKCLWEWTPNLKSLILYPQNYCFRESNPLTPKGPPLFLPKLKKVTLPKKEMTLFSTAANIICQILTSAPNLTSIDDPDLAHVTDIILAGKVSLVNSLNWSFLLGGVSTVQIDNLLLFVAAGPKLTSLTLRDFTHPSVSNSNPDPRIFPALSSLLTSGQNSLEKVTGVEILGQYGDLQLSPFSNLTELHVSADDSTADKILPQGHDLSRIAPNLKSLHLKAEKAEVYPFTSPSNAHNSLQKLEISISAFKLTSQNVRQWVETLGGHYPNITQLDISIRHKGLENIPECLKLIPKYFKNLEQLVLRFWIAKIPEDSPECAWNLDAALTGLYNNECNILKKYDDEPMLTVDARMKISDNVRTISSILDLKKLTNLTFEVQFKGKVRPLWSRVAQMYAFQPMAKRQGLQVNVRGFYTNRITGNELGPL